MTHQTPKWQGLDFVRFFCVLFMVFIHATFWLIAYDGKSIDTNNFLVPIINYLHILGVFPLCIPATAGASLRLHFSPFLRSDRLKNYSLAYLLKISIFLAIVAYFTQMLTWGEQTFIWDVFFFICFSYVLISLILKFTNIYVLISFAMLVLGLTGVMRELLAGNTSLWALTLVGDPKQNYFWPIFPWFSTIVFGLVVTDIFLKLKRPLKFGEYAFAMGTAIALLAYHFTDSLLVVGGSDIWSDSIFKPELGGLFFVLGSFLILVGLGEVIGSKVTFRKYGIINCYSKGILWIAVFHQLIGINLVWWLLESDNLRYLAIGFPLLLLGISWMIGIVTVFVSDHQFTINFKKSGQ